MITALAQQSSLLGLGSEKHGEEAIELKKEWFKNVASSLEKTNQAIDKAHVAIGDLQKAFHTHQLDFKTELAKLKDFMNAELKDLNLPRQDHFVDPKVVRVDFGADEIAVNDETTFSASSQVFLKKAFHSGLLVASCAQNYFRFPRFLILDGIEDGGMEIERSHHLQNLIVELSGTLGVDHQIIIGTSQIAPNLDVPAHTVGREFTHEMKSLQLSGIS